ncbi:MAG: PDZ domain-containing protein [Gordonia sp. (in: high G+C Gram-positive bacteria)]|uniref:YlbL family protein n=1 Tax=Gordonia sp. (in: high G+C Gram-positive bacteria) TaxID=84139 RepID=UPI0039E6F77B
MKRNNTRRLLISTLVAVVVVVAFVLLGSFAKIPYVALSPGPTVNTLGEFDGKPVVVVTGGEDDHPKGHSNLTTVSLTDQITLFQGIGMWVSGDYQLQPRELYFPRGKSDDEVRKENVQQMMGSGDNATGAALTYLKRPTAVGIGSIADDSPAKGRLEVNDVLVAVDGTAVGTAQQVHDRIRSRKPGEKVTLTVNRAGGEKAVEVTLAARPDDAAAGYLGVTPKAVSADPKIRITYNTGDIGGPSAGLMPSLAVIDHLTPGDLSGGRFIAGTGTVVPAGEVGPIGGIQHKLRAAKKAGAEAFLVPADNCKEALDDAPDGLELVKVGSVTEAVDALGALDAGRPRPHC